ncbi:ABC-type multidrug transport system fused ATPase/permease subunit [Stackebrandtia endophytica]|uniref:ABC-type multidrug transport system fused ATPase/permease subunit n=1 Tax=Stackebrandtia endophytica TaxID=1496996 RepID=A0A543AUH4_9ACTN|nr:ABC transporter ATP-binding protein [Stackebrandtia endophytica]TQL76209.1 ABC-type multidrug transport system fused ATPase/permease subunit [Stackebrandtia endophytica]
MTTVQTPVDEANTATSWRGRAEADDAERTTAEATDAASIKQLRGRSQALLRSLLRPHKRQIIGIVILLLIMNAANLAGPYLVMLGISNGIPALTDGNDYSVLTAVGIAFGLVTIAEYAATRSEIALSGRVSQSLLLELRRRVFNHFNKLSVSFHERFTSGRVVARMTSDMDAIRELSDNGVHDLVLAALSVVSIAGIMLFMDVELALVALVTFPIMGLLGNWFRKYSTVVYRRTRETIALVIVYFVESMSGVRAVQSYRREPRNQRIFDRLNDDNRDANINGHRAAATFAASTKGIGNLSIAIVLMYGGYLVMEGRTDVGVLVAFLLYLRRFYEPMQELTMFYNTLQSATAALEKLSGVLDEKPEVASPAKPVALPQANGVIEFDDVMFSYRDDKVVLPDMNLTIPAGQTIAIVGATGAGKTTMAKLVSRFYDPVSGVVSLDGVNLKDLSEADLSRAIAMVTQENYMFDGTIGENIAFGKPSAGQEEIEAAAKAIGAHDFIAALPDGYDTDVRKRGGRLSAGQRQLVAFARAFLADPRVLILDEATSSLDIPSERLVQHALRTILADRTAIIIAHRLSTVEIADRVLVLDAGRIVEDGPPAVLISGSGRYAKLHEQWEDSLV